MKDYKNWILRIVALVASLVFVFYAIKDEASANIYRGILVFCTLIICFFSRKSKSIPFLLFLLMATIAELCYFLGRGLDFYFVNSFYIIGYLCLFYHLIKPIESVGFLRKFKFHLFILIILGVYLLLSLNKMVSHTHNYSYTHLTIETIYNISFVAVLIASIIHFMCFVDRKAFILLLACLAIVFSELIQTSSFYVKSTNVINTIYSSLFVIAFILFERYHFQDKVQIPKVVN